MAALSEHEKATAEGYNSPTLQRTDGYDHPGPHDGIQPGISSQHSPEGGNGEYEECQPTVFESNGIVFGHQPESDHLNSTGHYYWSYYPNGARNPNYSAPNGWYGNQNMPPYLSDAQASAHYYHFYPTQSPAPHPSDFPNSYSYPHVMVETTEPTSPHHYQPHENQTAEAQYGGSDDMPFVGENYPNAEELASATRSLGFCHSNPESTSQDRGTSLGSTIDERREIEPVSFHLLRAFKSEDFADCKLTLESSSGRFYTLPYPLHRLIASRSNHLLYLMDKLGSNKSPTRINAVSGGCFIQPKAFEMALRNLYGLTLINQQQLDGQAFAYSIHGHNPLENVSFASSSVARMDFALCYATSGAFLADSAIMKRGLQLAITEIQWETVEKLLLFGLRPSEFMIACTNREVSDHASSSANSDHGRVDEHNQASDASHIYPDDLYLSAYCLNREIANTWASKLLQMGLEFIADNVSLTFKLDKDAQSLILPTRFAGALLLADVSTPHVEFGEFSSDNTSANCEATILSGIFLSLPFKALKKLFKLMMTAEVASLHLAEDIIAERERRRLRALRNVQLKGLVRSNTGDAPLRYECLGWEESIKPHPSNLDNKFSISKVWKGLNSNTLVFESGLDRGYSSA